MSTSGALRHMLVVDVRFGARDVVGRFFLAGLLMLILVCLFRFLALGNDGIFLDVGFIDCFACLFGGMSEYDPYYDKSFNVPASWLCVCLMGAFVVLSYPTRNLESIGIKQCIAAHGRWCWWISKCIWTVACTFFYWLLSIAVSMVTSGTWFWGEGLALSAATPELLGFFAAGDCVAFEGSQELLHFVVGVPFVLSALNLIQLALSVNTNPLVAFAVTAATLIIAAFYLDSFLLGNYLMLARSELVIHDGVNAVCGIVLSLVVGASAVYMGGRAFDRHDLLGKERYSS